MRVLYVDDSRYTRSVLQRVLEKEGYEAVGHASGAEVMETLRQGRPDLLITDLLMEGVGGLEVLRFARGLYPDLPIVVVTADIQDTTMNECKKLGANCVLSKNALFPEGNAFVEAVRALLPPSSRGKS